MAGLTDSQRCDRDFFLRHFHYVADQRLKVMGFYFTVAAASLILTANFMTTVESPTQVLILRIIGGFHVFLALVFRLLDIRCQRLVEVAIYPLVELEKQTPRKVERVFINDFDAQARRKKHSGRLSSYASFSQCFSALTTVHAFAGLLLIASAQGLKDPIGNHEGQQHEEQNHQKALHPPVVEECCEHVVHISD